MWMLFVAFRDDCPRPPFWGLSSDHHTSSGSLMSLYIQSATDGRSLIAPFWQLDRVFRCVYQQLVSTLSWGSPPNWCLESSPHSMQYLFSLVQGIQRGNDPQEEILPFNALFNQLQPIIFRSHPRGRFPLEDPGDGDPVFCGVPDLFVRNEVKTPDRVWVFVAACLGYYDRVGEDQNSMK